MFIEIPPELVFEQSPVIEYEGIIAPQLINYIKYRSLYLRSIRNCIVRHQVNNYY